MASSALSVAVPKTEKALKAGWGFKCNQRHTSWQRRYQPTRTKNQKSRHSHGVCTTCSALCHRWLSYDGTSLTWREDPRGAVKGEIDMSATGVALTRFVYSCGLCVQGTSLSPPPHPNSTFKVGFMQKKPPTEHYFGINCPGRSLRLAFDSSQDEKDWFTALR